MKPTHPQLRLGFAGTPVFAARILAALLANHFSVSVVYTQPDRPTGRGRKLSASAVKQLAVESGIPVRQPASLKGESLLADKLDVLVVAAYGLLLPPHILRAPRYGCINVHASLLPRWRGAAPVERAIMAGDRVTGVSIMQMDEGLDTGPVYRRVETPITTETTGESLEHTLADLGARALLEVLVSLPATPEPQQGEASYASKLTRKDTVINWQAPASRTAAQIRALTGRMPVTCGSQGARVRILRASSHDGQIAAPGEIVYADKRGIGVQCGEGVLVVEALQLDRGKGKPMTAAAALSGYPDLFKPGCSLDERAGK